MNRVIKITFVFILCLWQLSVAAQQYYFENYGLKEGLIQASVKCFEQDSKGYIWVGTDGGVSIFDGNKINDFSTKEGLINNRINSIHRDKFDNIWVGTSNGVSVISRGERIQKTHSINSENGLFVDRSTLVVSDNEGDVLVFSAGIIQRLKYKEVLNPFNKDSIEKIEFEKTSFPDSLSKSSAVCFQFDEKRNCYWVGTTGGLLQYDLSYKLLNHHKLSSERNSNVVNTILIDPINRLWLGTDGNLSIFDVDKNLMIIRDSIGGRVVRNVDNLFRDSKNNVWCSGPTTNLLKWSEKSFSYEFVRYMNDSKGSENRNSNIFFEDREGNMWLGGSGVAKFRNRKFEIFTTSEGLANNSVRGVIQDNNGVMWVGTGSTLQKIDSVFDQEIYGLEVSYFDNFPTKNGMKHSSIWGLLADSKGNIWFSGSAGGVWKMKGDRGERVNERESFKGRIAGCIYEARNEKIWLATYDQINVYDPDKDYFYQPFPEGDDLHSKRGYAFADDLEGNFWVSHSAGLTKINQKGERIHYTTENGLVNDFILIIKVDDNGNLWLATGSGVTKFDGKKFTNYSTKDYLTSDTPYLLQFDNDGHLWVGTNKGVDKLLLNANSEVIGVKHYGRTQGFLGIETNARASCLDDKGDLWFGTQGGLVRYNKQEDVDSEEPPLVDITGFSINLEPALMHNQLELNYNQSHISFDFIGVTFTNAEEVKYRYMLKGFDQNWNRPTDKNHISYSNLDAGEYEFKVEATNNGNIWSDSSSFYFEITPPFWKTWWFYLLMTGAVVFLIYLYLKFKTKKLMESKRVLEEKVTERTEELQTANESISSHRDKLERFNNDILDSIKYAERIQSAILPSVESLKYHFPESFVLYKPKDIVGGDFYWLKEMNDKLFFAVIDCTGHGVPGGFMSIIAYNNLNKAINELSITKPSEILDFMNKAIPEALNTTIGTDFKDGIDICLCAYDKKNKQLEYSGIFNALWITSENKTINVDDKPLQSILSNNDNHFFEIKANRIPIGFSNEKYVNHIINLNMNDQLYLFSDGIADQFGGKMNKKYSSQRLKDLLISNSIEDAEVQRGIINKELDTWMKDGNEQQIDDICIMGLKLQ